MHFQTRLLVRHFVRGYLSNDLTGGERQAALSAALLISPGLFTTVLLAAKYVVTPFAVPGLSALGGFADRLDGLGKDQVDAVTGKDQARVARRLVDRHGDRPHSRI